MTQIPITQRHESSRQQSLDRPFDFWWPRPYRACRAGRAPPSFAYANQPALVYRTLLFFTVHQLVAKKDASPLSGSGPDTGPHPMSSVGRAHAGKRNGLEPPMTGYRSHVVVDGSDRPTFYWCFLSCLQYVITG
mgnify:CR=1 FL=1